MPFHIVVFLPLAPAALRAQTPQSSPTEMAGLLVSPVISARKPINFGNNSAPPPGAPANPRTVPPNDPPWSITLTPAYQFINQRSRVGGGFLNIEATNIDLTAADNNWPFTILDFAYNFAHAGGSSAFESDETANQHLGSFQIVQPFDWMWDCTWQPAFLHEHRIEENIHNQFAVILQTDFGGSWVSATGSQLLSNRGTTYAFVQNALFDYQLVWFNGKQCLPEDRDYPNLVLECTSGMEVGAFHFDSAEHAASMSSSGSEVTYRNIASLTYSFCNRFGVLVGAEWDAPLNSEPLQGSRPDYANVVTFTAGLIYNLYPGQVDRENFFDLNRLSVSVLYSYTAFNPVTETNQLRVQISYGF